MDRNDQHSPAALMPRPQRSTVLRPRIGHGHPSWMGARKKLWFGHGPWKDGGLLEETPPFVPSGIDRLGRWMIVAVAAAWLLGLVAGFTQSLAALTILGLVPLVLGFFAPHWSAIGLAVLCTIDPLTRVYLLSGGGFRWNTFNYLLLAGSVLFAPLILRARELPLRLLVIVCGFLTLEILWSPNVAYGQYHTLNLIGAVGVYVLLMRSLRSPETLYWLGLIACFNATAGGLVFFLQKDTIGHIDENAFSYFPIGGLFGACLALPYALAHRRLAAPIIAMVATNVVWLFLTGSRGGFLAAMPSLIYIFTRLPGLKRKLIWIGVAGAILAVVMSAFPELAERTVARFQKLARDEETIAARTSGRSDLAYGAYRIFLQHPWGVGTGGFSYYWAIVSVEEAHRLSGYRRGVEQSCHSGWMKTLCENGVPGFLLFAAFVGSYAYVGWRRRKLGQLPLGLLTTASLTISLISTEFAGKGMWLLASTAIVLLYRPVGLVSPPTLPWPQSPQEAGVA